MKQFIYRLVATVMLFTAAETVATEGSKATFLMLVSPKAKRGWEYIGQGKAQQCREDDGTFRLSQPKINEVELRYNPKKQMSGIWWDFRFRQEAGTPVTSGIYTALSRYPFGQGACVDFGGSGRGCNNLIGDLNILDITHDEEGNIQSFAANLLQHCETIKHAPLFVGIRYNSSIPVIVKPEELYSSQHKPASFIHYLECPRTDAETPDRNEVFHNITSNQTDFTIKCSQIEDLSGFGRGIDIKIASEPSNIWFTLPVPKKKYLKEWRHSVLAMSDDAVFYTDDYYYLKEYRIRELKLNDSKQVIKFAVDFIAETEDGKIIQGSLRHNSDVAVNLEKPYND